MHKDINHVYEWGHGEGIDIAMEFHKSQESQLILTNTDWQKAKLKVDKIANKIRGKHVLEIGAGVGFAAIEMAKIADTVTAIESDPAWNWIFCKHLYKIKPDNLCWIFDRLDSVEDHILDLVFFDVVVIFTRSGIDQLKVLGTKFAEKVIMYHQEYENEPGNTSEID